MDNCVPWPFILSTLVVLVITRYPKGFSDFRESFFQLPCNSFHLNNHMDNSRTCRVSAYPQLFMCFTKVFEILFDTPKILSSLLLCNTCLLALWMLTILGRIIEFILPACTSFDQELFLDQSNCRQLYP